MLYASQLKRHYVSARACAAYLPISLLFLAAACSGGGGGGSGSGCSSSCSGSSGAHTHSSSVVHSVVEISQFVLMQDTGMQHRARSEHQR